MQGHAEEARGACAGISGSARSLCGERLLDATARCPQHVPLCSLGQWHGPEVGAPGGAARHICTLGAVGSQPGEVGEQAVCGVGESKPSTHPQAVHACTLLALQQSNPATHSAAQLPANVHLAVSTPPQVYGAELQARGQRAPPSARAGKGVRQHGPPAAHPPSAHTAATRTLAHSEPTLGSSGRPAQRTGGQSHSLASPAGSKRLPNTVRLR